MAKKNTTKQPEVSTVWDDETETQTHEELSQDDSDIGTEADNADLDNPTDEELAEVGELIDGTEDDITALEQQEDAAEVASDVGGDDSFPVTAAVKAAIAAAKSKKVKEAPMAEKMTKADHIRAEIEKRQKSDASMRPRDIIEALTKKGIEVTAPQVSVMVKKATGGKSATPKAEKTEKVRTANAVKRPGPKTEKRAAPAKSPKVGGVAQPSGMDKQQFDLLFDAAAFVEKCGGVQSAINALSAYERLTALRG